VRAGIAEHPAAAVDVQDDGQGSGRAARTHDPDGNVADLGRDRDPFVIDVGQGDGAGLDLVQQGARAVDPALGEGRRLGGGLREGAGLGLQRVLGHVVRPLGSGAAWGAAVQAKTSAAAAM